ncbi:aminoacyl-tRNA hydrolase [Kiritimatiella glycovorans]|uniref:Peptidyl-tRNA hydrolase n=1 Tax=Kiritimatiella glycovorans TaxID=1307763 RepID=A0A0G3EI01_9BACT|nr:aminoacyl-tRNA hydrolase [Kiritimatiella glycovorans]AKJ64435.1 Peptidyl-tRNA hydrolase [Kiritimatiella glycovorans]
MKAVIGLGNPGPRYSGTRHNAGFEVLDELAQRLGVAFRRKWRLKSDLAEAPGFDQPVWLVKPRTLMNRSGEAATAVLRRSPAEMQDLLLVYDDLALDLGRIRVRPGGSAGGHNGVRSVAAALGAQDVPRLRIGVGPRPPGADQVAYVLGRFTPDEREVMNEVRGRAADAVEAVLRDGVEAAMNAHNGRE